MCVWLMIGSRQDIKYWLWSRNEHMICSAMLICATSFTWRLPSMLCNWAPFLFIEWGQRWDTSCTILEYIRLHYRVMWHVNANRERGISSTWYAMNQPRWFGFEEVEWSFNLCELRIFHLVKILNSVRPNDHNHKYHNMCIVGMAFIHSVSIWFCDGRLPSMILIMCAKYIGKTI